MPRVYPSPSTPGHNLARHLNDAVTPQQMEAAIAEQAPALFPSINREYQSTFVKATRTNGFSHWVQSMAFVHDGKIHAFYSPSYRSHAALHIVSSDGGMTWSDPRQIISKSSGDLATRYHVQGAGVDAETGHFFVQMEYTIDPSNVLDKIFQLWRSTDGGQTWTKIVDELQLSATQKAAQMQGLVFQGSGAARRMLIGYLWRDLGAVKDVGIAKYDISTISAGAIADPELVVIRDDASNNSGATTFWTEASFAVLSDTEAWVTLRSNTPTKAPLLVHTADAFVSFETREMLEMTGWDGATIAMTVRPDGETMQWLHAHRYNSLAPVYTATASLTELRADVTIAPISTRQVGELRAYDSAAAELSHTASGQPVSVTLGSKVVSLFTVGERGPGWNQRGNLYSYIQDFAPASVRRDFSQADVEPPDHVVALTFKRQEEAITGGRHLTYVDRLHIADDTHANGVAFEPPYDGQPGQRAYFYATSGTRMLLWTRAGVTLRRFGRSVSAYTAPELVLVELVCVAPAVWEITSEPMSATDWVAWNGTGDLILDGGVRGVLLTGITGARTLHLPHVIRARDVMFVDATGAITATNTVTVRGSLTSHTINNASGAAPLVIREPWTAGRFTPRGSAAWAAELGNPKILVSTGTAELDFPEIAAGGEATLTISVPGALATGQPSVSLGWSAALPDGIVVKQAWCSSTGVVSVRVANVSAVAINPASVTCRATVHRQA